MSKLDKDAVIAKFTEAYKKANGKEPTVEAAGGWYSVDGGKKMRLAALDEMANELAGGSAPAAEPKKEAKAEPKAKPAAKKPAKKKAAAKKASSFSVKDYWNNKLTEQDANNRAPR